MLLNNVMAGLNVLFQDPIITVNYQYINISIYCFFVKPQAFAKKGLLLFLKILSCGKEEKREIIESTLKFIK